MPVREEEDLDAGEVDGQPLGVGQPNIAVGTDVEQHGRGPLTLPSRGEGREPMTGDAELIEPDNTVVPLVLAARRDAAEQQVRQLG